MMVNSIENRCEEWFRNIDEVGGSAQHLPCIINQPYGYMYILRVIYSIYRGANVGKTMPPWVIGDI